MSDTIDMMFRDGAPWQQPEVKAAGLFGEQCSMWVGNFLFGQWQCEKPATHTVSGGCVHEHTVAYVACEDHAGRERLFCNQCTDGAETHECPLAMTAVPLVGDSA